MLVALALTSFLHHFQLFSDNILWVSLQNMTLMNFNPFCCISNSWLNNCDPKCRKVRYKTFRSNTFRNAEAMNLWGHVRANDMETSKSGSDINYVAKASETKLKFNAADYDDELHHDGVAQPMSTT